MTGLPYYNSTFERTSPRIEYNAELETLQAALQSERLTSEIEAGNVTIAMIRPELTNNTVSRSADPEAAFELESAISNLGVAIKFSIQFDEIAMSAFYGGRPQEVQEAIPPERSTDYENRWQEFVALMTSGPSTVLFLYSPGGDAIGTWRQQVGHYDIVNRRDPSTIRGKFGVDNYNNLVHGSDSKEAVLNEKSILLELLDRTAQSSYSREPVLGYLDESLLAQLRIGHLERSEIVQEWLPGSEVYFARLAIKGSGVEEQLVTKACIKMFPSEVMSEWIVRRNILMQSGVETPTLKAVSGSTIVEEYIPYTLREAYQIAEDNVRQKLKENFIITYRQVIASGFRPTSLHDVRSHGEDIVLVDFGEDLGAPYYETSLDDAAIFSASEKEWERIIGRSQARKRP